MNGDNLQSDRSVVSFISGYSVAMRIIVYAIEFCVLCCFGHFIDVTFNFSPWGLFSGGMIGLTTFFLGIVSIAKGVEDTELSTDQNLKKEKKDSGDHRDNVQN